LNNGSNCKGMCWVPLSQCCPAASGPPAHFIWPAAVLWKTNFRLIWRTVSWNCQVLQESADYVWKHMCVQSWIFSHEQH